VLYQDPNTELPDFSEEIANPNSYYYLCGENLLFINVQRDFQRIAPLLEAAISYANFNKVYFLDIARVEAKGLSALSNKLFDLGRGGWMPQKIREKCRGKRVEFINFSNFDIDPNLNVQSFTLDEELAMRVARSHEYPHINPNPSSQKLWLETNKLYCLDTVSRIQRIIDTLKIKRLFVWNGRFVKSTLVTLAGNRMNVATSSIETGSNFRSGYSFEVFFDPRTPTDDYRRVMDLKRRQELRKIPRWDLQECLDWISQGLQSQFSFNFEDAFEQQFDVVYFSSSMVEKPTNPRSWPKEDYQFNVCKLIFEICQKEKKSFAIRVHPHPEYPVYADYEDAIWQEFVSTELDPSVGLISASSNISSYELAKRATSNIVLRSTIALDLKYLNIPCCFLWYRIDRPFATDERLQEQLQEAIAHPKMLSDEIFKAKVNYDVAYRGFRFSHFDKQGIRLTFNGNKFGKERTLLDSTLFRILVRLKKVAGVRRFLKDFSVS